MPFKEKTKVQLRQQLVHRVQQKECSITQAAREYGVSRPTVYEWLSRANADEKADGLEALCDHSRRPGLSPHATPDEVVKALVDAKGRFPHWGAKKLLVELWPDGKAPLSVRTADRILARHALVRSRNKPEPWQRFERSECNQLWQMDFKGMHRSGQRRLGYWPLTVLDDCSRYCLRFEPLAQQQSDLVFEVLWHLFAEVGLPDALLTDNGTCFSGTWGDGPGRLEVKLWRLGIRTTQGRPYHPQTQGKVERFHRTIGEELGEALRQPSIEAAREVYAPVVRQYNWKRPHEALDMRVPGVVYVPSARSRPDRLPEHELSETAIKRKVHPNGDVSYKGRLARAGKGLAGETVEIREEDHAPAIYYAGVLVKQFEVQEAKKV